MGSFIITSGGTKFDFLTPTVEQIVIEQIAGSLAVIPRFNGHTRWWETGRPFSVGQHSIVVSALIHQEGGSVYEQLWGLLHDASEAFTGDCSSPLKALLPGFRAIEDATMRVICDKFGLHHDQPEVVQWADQQAIRLEARDLHHPEMMKYFTDPDEHLKDVKILPWTPQAVYSAFLDRFDCLTELRRKQAQ